MLLLSRYAREDTHYLLYIYDLMKQRLQRESTPENDLLLEVNFVWVLILYAEVSA
jgi:ribonuclease D